MDSLLALPVISEKAMAIVAANNCYAFLVPKSAGKTAIARAVATKFGVKVTRVNTTIIKGKPKQMSVQRGRRRLSGSRSDFKKAYVVLAKGETIKLFEDKGEKK